MSNIRNLFTGQNPREDIVWALRANAAIARNDADGRLGWPSAVSSRPVHIMPTSTKWSLL